MKKFEIGETVFCFYGDTLPCVECQIYGKARLTLAGQIVQNCMFHDGSDAEFLIEHIFATKDECLNYYKNIINLTPHDIILCDENGTVIQSIPSTGKIARAQEIRTQIDEINGIPVYKIEYGNTIDLPEPQDNTIYIVSSLTAQAAKDRTDLYIPADSVRDAHGKIIGCRGLAKI
ncbi:MAG: hypothetical protein M0R51_11055 [Clostridia bacterium]|jgi:hypothetical protein|nr:hypothetical protein [Clostridia bacterium]